ncbi:MAG: cell division initiation protein [Actinomycetota bacterium]|nr:cell division initiation protein [Actinomycetota bacterium]
MDLSPKLLTEVQFREQWRGYNPDEVDEFLERVASGLEELQQRLADTVERASNAERRLLERSDDDEIRRTLVLAQRTAVASMDEARTEAERLVSETELRCRELVAEAEAQAARLDADIATRRRVELGDLAAQRAALEADVDALRSFVDSERSRLGEVVRVHLEWLESGYSIAEEPATSDVAAPESDAAAESDAPEPEVEQETALDANAVDDLRAARVGLADALRRAGVESDDDRSPDATGAFDALAEPDDDEPHVEPTWRDEPEPEPEHHADDDPFLAELRRAVGDTEPLGPRDHHLHDGPSVVDLHVDEVPSGGFFRRGKRRS